MLLVEFDGYIADLSGVIFPLFRCEGAYSYSFSYTLGTDTKTAAIDLRGNQNIDYHVTAA